MSSSCSAGLQSMSVISPQLVVAAMAITELLPAEGGRRGHYDYEFLAELALRCKFY